MSLKATITKSVRLEIRVVLWCCVVCVVMMRMGDDDCECD